MTLNYTLFKQAVTSISCEVKSISNDPGLLEAIASLVVAFSLTHSGHLSKSAIYQTYLSNIPATNQFAAKLDKSILLTVITVTNLKSSLNSQIHIASQECNFVLVFCQAQFQLASELAI